MITHSTIIVLRTCLKLWHQ